MRATVQKCAVDYQRLWPYWKSERGYCNLFTLSMSSSLHCDVSVIYIKPSMFLLSKFLLCNECYRIVDKYYRQNKEVTVITLVWSICSNWITASELDLEIIRCSQPWNHVTHGNYRSLLFGYAVILMLLFLVKRKSWKQFQGLLTKEKLSHRHAYKSLFKSYNNG